MLHLALSQAACLVEECAEYDAHDLILLDKRLLSSICYEPVCIEGVANNALASKLEPLVLEEGLHESRGFVTGSHHPGSLTTESHSCRREEAQKQPTCFFFIKYSACPLNFCSMKACFVTPSGGASG